MTIAVLGTGIMGAAVARNWLRAGETVRVWNRTPATAEPLAADGAVVCATPQECVSGAGTVVTVLFDAASVISVITAAAPAAGSLWLQLSTVGVPGADDLARHAERLGLRYVDAPVLGTRQPAEQGKLTVLGSGPDEVRERVERLCAPIATKVVWFGAAGTASRMKLVVNAWVLSVVAGAAQSVALADALGLDPQSFLDLVAGGALDTPYLQLKAASMMRRDYPVSFPLAGAAKDAALISALAAESGVDTSLVDAAAGLFATATERGFGEADIAALYEAFRPA